MVERKWEYKSFSPMLPPPEERRHSAGPRADHDDMAHWLNHMDSSGWEFVGFGEKHWVTGPSDTYWIFRRTFSESGND